VTNVHYCALLRKMKQVAFEEYGKRVANDHGDSRNGLLAGCRSTRRKVYSAHHLERLGPSELARSRDDQANWRDLAMAEDFFWASELNRWPLRKGVSMLYAEISEITLQ